MNNIKLMIIDLDGTLVDTAPDIYAAANHVLDTLGYPRRSMGEVKDAIGHGVHELMSKLIHPAAVTECLLGRAVDLFKEHYHGNLVRETKSFPGVEEVLEGPLAGVKKAVVTNKPDDLTREILQKLNLARFFDAVIGTGRGFGPKPDPAGVLSIMQKFKAGANQTLMIGDSSVDRDTAARAGIGFVWVSYGYEKLSGNGFVTCAGAREWAKLA